MRKADAWLCLKEHKATINRYCEEDVPLYLRTPEDRATLIAAADELQDFASAEWTQRQDIYKGYAQRLAKYEREYNTSMAIVTKLREMAGS